MRNENVKIRINGDASGAEKAFQRTAKAAKVAMKTVATAAAATAAAAFAEAVNQTRKFDKQMSELSAITGATGKDLDLLRNKSIAFGAETTKSAAQVAEGFKLVASAKPDLLENAAALSAVTREVITLSEAANIDMAAAANTVGGSLNQFGATADQASRFVNVLAAGAKFGASAISDTAQAMKVAGTVASNAGLSFEQTNAAIQALAKVSLKGSQAGTGLRGVLLKLSTQSRDKFNPEIVGFTQAIQNLSKAHLTTAEKSKLFGQESITAANALIQEAGSLDTLTQKLTGTATAIEQATTNTNNWDGDIQRLNSQINTLALDIGTDLMPTVRSLTKSFTDGIEGVRIFYDLLSHHKTIETTSIKLSDLSEEIANTKRELEHAKSGDKTWMETLIGNVGPDDPVITLQNKLISLQAKYKDVNAERTKLLGDASSNQGASPESQNLDIEKQKIEALKAQLQQKIEALKAQLQQQIEALKAQLQQQHTTSPTLTGGTGGNGASKVQQAQDEARKIIDIHSLQWEQLKVMAEAAYGDQEALRLAKVDADMLALEDERQRHLDAIALQIQDTDELRQAQMQVNAYYDGLEIQRADTFAKSMADIKVKAASWEMKQTHQFLGAMEGLMSSKSRILFETGKVAAAANIGIHSAEAAWSVFNNLAKVDPTGGFIAGAAAAAVVAKGVADAQAVMSRKMGAPTGGSSGNFAVNANTGVASGGGGYTPATAAVPQSQQQTPPAQQVHVYINGTTTLEHLTNEILPTALKDKISNQDFVLIDQNSTQHQVLQAA